MTTTRWHLPAVMPLPGREWAKMTTACQKRGPIVPREMLGDGPQQMTLETVIASRQSMACPDCVVKFDEAEESGAMAPWWVANRTREWRGPGGCLYRDRPEPHVCGNCRKAGGYPGFEPYAMLVVLLPRPAREAVRRVALLPAEKTEGASAHRPEGET